jgi:hypothetical protein
MGRSSHAPPGPWVSAGGLWSRLLSCVLSCLVSEPGARGPAGACPRRIAESALAVPAAGSHWGVLFFSRFPAKPRVPAKSTIYKPRGRC